MLDLTPLQICLNSSTIMLREWTVQKNFTQQTAFH